MTHSDGLSPELRERIDELVADAVGQGQAPGVVAGVAHGRERHVAAAGALAVAGGPMRRDSLFRISSMTKPMTAAAVLSQVEAGLIELAEPVDRLLPELAGRAVLRAPDAMLPDTVRWQIETVGGLFAPSDAGTVAAPPPVVASTQAKAEHPVMYASRSINMRAEPSVSAPIVVNLKRGASVAILEKRGSWDRVEISAPAGTAKQTEGWVFNTYLVDADPTIAAAASAPAAATPVAAPAPSAPAATAETHAEVPVAEPVAAQPAAASVAATPSESAPVPAAATPEAPTP